MASYFSDEFYHAGGDEINVRCWEEDECVIDYLSKNKGSTVETLLAKFIGEVQVAVKSASKTPIFWQETIVNHNLSLNKDTIIQIWKGKDDLKAVTRKGFRTIAGSYEYWYLDCGHGDWYGNNTDEIISWYVNCS